MSRSDETSTRTRGMPRWDLRRSLVLGVVLGVVSLALLSAPAAFAVERHSGKHVAPVLDTDHKRMYRTNLREAAKRAPDFAGRFVLTHWGCGSSCRVWALINVATGAVMFPDIDKMGNRKDAPYPAWGSKLQRRRRIADFSFWTATDLAGSRDMSGASMAEDFTTYTPSQENQMKLRLRLSMPNKGPGIS